jgi:hypothetical protein
MAVRVVTPAAVPVNGGGIIISLNGQGMALANPQNFNFSKPLGATGRAILITTQYNHFFKLEITFLSGSFQSHQFIEFTISGFTNPAAPQPSQNVQAISLDNPWAVYGSYPAIVDEITPSGSPGYNQPPPTNAPGPDGSFQRALLEPNSFRLSFSTRHLCSSGNGTMRGCLLKNASFPSGTYLLPLL